MKFTKIQLLVHIILSDILKFLIIAKLSKVQTLIIFLIIIFELILINTVISELLIFFV